MDVRCTYISISGEEKKSSLLLLLPVAACTLYFHPAKNSMFVWKSDFFYLFFVTSYCPPWLCDASCLWNRIDRMNSVCYAPSAWNVVVLLLIFSFRCDAFIYMTVDRQIRNDWNLTNMQWSNLEDPEQSNKCDFESSEFIATNQRDPAESTGSNCGYTRL